MAVAVALLLTAMLAGSAVYCVLTILAARRYLDERAGGAGSGSLPISILKPLAGADEGLQQNLRSFFDQDYPDFEILFAVRGAEDPAAVVVDKLCREYPHIPTQLIVTGESPYANPKTYSLELMMGRAANDLLVMSDSDIRVTPDFLAAAAAEFRDPRVALASCPYRAVPGGSAWSTLEAVEMNTTFIGGVLAARMLEGMKFALGPTIIARRRALLEMGGFNRLKEYLAEDFLMGKLIAELGHSVILSAYVIEHRIGSQGFGANSRHRLRWCRSTRRSRPWGYVGQVFTNPVPLALLLLAVQPSWWLVAAAAGAFRAAAAWATAGWVLHDPLTKRLWWLVPFQDVVSFVFWAAGFFGNKIHWRGRTYLLLSDGKFQRMG